MTDRAEYDREAMHAVDDKLVTLRARARGRVWFTPDEVSTDG